MSEKLYLIHNPLTGSRNWVSEREFNIGSERLKHVFGVLYLSDVEIMLRYNLQLKEAIINEYQITNEKEVSLHHVCRLINIAELTELINKEIQDTAPFHEKRSFDPPYPKDIEIKDGHFIWNAEEKCYDEAFMTIH